MAIIYYAGSVWLNWSDRVVYGLIAFAVIVSPISWMAEDRKRARKLEGHVQGG